MQPSNPLGPDQVNVIIIIIDRDVQFSAEQTIVPPGAGLVGSRSRISNLGSSSVLNLSAFPSVAFS
jgi:hypothetical protein